MESGILKKRGFKLIPAWFISVIWNEIRFWNSGKSYYKF